MFAYVCLCECIQKWRVVGVHKGQKRAPLSHHSPPILLNQGLSLNLRLTFSHVGWIPACPCDLLYTPPLQFLLCCFETGSRLAHVGLKVIMWPKMTVSGNSRYTSPCLADHLHFLKFKGNWLRELQREKTCCFLELSSLWNMLSYCLCSVVQELRLGEIKWLSQAWRKPRLEADTNSEARVNLVSILTMPLMAIRCLENSFSL